MSEHLDLDALADVLDGEASTQPLARPAAEHLTECAECRAALDELRTAAAGVTEQLAALPVLTVPDDVASRLGSALRDAAVPAGGASLTTLPTAGERSAPGRWLAAAAAVAVLLAGAGYGISHLGGTGGGSASSTSAAGKAAPAGNVVRNDTGADYTSRETLAAALPGLLAGTAGSMRAADSAVAPNGKAQLSGPSPSAPEAMTLAAPDPLARLRTPAGLAECLLALLPPEDPSVRPLALDYAAFKGAPAMVVVLPGTVAGKLDVFVVGPACSRANDSTLFYTSVPKP
jgi:hypothetical protein